MTQKPKRKPQLKWWQRQVTLPLIVIVMGIVVMSWLLIQTLTPPEPIIEFQNIYASPTYIPSDPRYVNTTFISSQMSATPDPSPLPSRNPQVPFCTEFSNPPAGKFVFRIWRQASKDLYRVNEDGTDFCALTQDEFMDDQPAWSPDGTQIAYVSNADGYGIYIMNQDGTGRTKIFDEGTAFSFPLGRLMAHRLSSKPQLKNALIFM